MIFVCVSVEELEEVWEQTLCGHVDPPALPLQHL